MLLVAESLELPIACFAWRRTVEVRANRTNDVLEAPYQILFNLKERSMEGMIEGETGKVAAVYCYP